MAKSINLTVIFLRKELFDANQKNETERKETLFNFFCDNSHCPRWLFKIE